MALGITDIASFTKTFIIPRATNNYHRSNAALWRLKRKGHRYDGGTQIESPITFQAPSGGGWFSDRDTWSIVSNQQFTNAVYQMREVVIPISVSGRDQAINNGPNAVKSFFKMKLKYATDEIADRMGTALQSNNASGKELDGWGLMISTSSTYGAIAVADFSGWVAQVQNASGNTMTLIGLQKVLGACTFGASRPTCMFSLQAGYDKFSTFGDTVQRIVDTDMASIGIAQLNFRGVPWVVDSHCPGGGDGTTTNSVRFINEDYFEFWTHNMFDMKSEDVASQPNEHVKRVNIHWKGNGICHSRRHSGELAQINTAL